MGRFEKIIQANDKYIPIDNDMSKAYLLKKNVLDSEQNRVDKAVEYNNLAKQKYAEMLNKFHPSDFKYAQKLMDEYTSKTANELLNNQGSPFLTTNMNHASDFVSRPEFQDMLQKGEFYKNQLKIQDELRAKGENSTTFLNGEMNQSLYDNDGNRKSGNYQANYTAKVLDYSSIMKDYFNDIQADAGSLGLQQAEFDQLKSGNWKGISTEKLDRIAETLFPNYIQSADGISQLKFLTTASTMNPNPKYSSDSEAMLEIKKQFKNTAKSKAFTQTQVSYQDDPIAKANRNYLYKQQLQNSKSQSDEQNNNNTPLAYLGEEIDYKGGTDRGFDLFSKNNVDYKIKMSSYKMNDVYNEIPKGKILNLSLDESNENEKGAKFETTSDKIKGTVTGAGVIYTFTDGELKGRPVQIGSNGNIETNQKIQSDKEGEYLWDEKSKKRLYVQKSFGKFVTNDNKEEIFIQSKDIRESIALTGENSTGVKYIDKIDDKSSNLKINDQIPEHIVRQFKASFLPNNMNSEELKLFVQQKVDNQNFTYNELIDGIEQAKQGRLNKIKNPELADFIEDVAEEILNPLMIEEVKSNIPNYGKAKQNNNFAPNNVYGSQPKQDIEEDEE